MRSRPQTSAKSSERCSARSTAPWLCLPCSFHWLPLSSGNIFRCACLHCDKLSYFHTRRWMTSDVYFVPPLPIIGNGIAADPYPPQALFETEAMRIVSKRIARQLSPFRCSLDQARNWVPYIVPYSNSSLVGIEDTYTSLISFMTTSRC